MSANMKGRRRGERRRVDAVRRERGRRRRVETQIGRGYARRTNGAVFGSVRVNGKGVMNVN